VNPGTQYGYRIKALIVYMNQYQLLPFHRLRDFFRDIFHQTISVGTFVNVIRRANQKFSMMEDQIKNLLKASEKLHVDETSLRVMNQRSWLHVASTSQLTYYDVHAKRGGEAIRKFIANFKKASRNALRRNPIMFAGSHSQADAHKVYADSLQRSK
jgi:transposase